MGMGFVRVTAASQKTFVADPEANTSEALEMIGSFADSHVIVFGEMSLTGYTCGDLYGQDALLDSALRGLRRVLDSTVASEQLVVLGMPLRVGNSLYNCAVAIASGKVLGVVPKQYLPNYQEFYDARWFQAADGGEPEIIDFESLGFPDLGTAPFGIDLLIQRGDLRIGIEICEDLWMPVPPSSLQASAGANLLLNLSGSNELIGKAEWRETLIRSQSGRCLAAYAYASAGPSESTTDLVFSGQCLIAENGAKLAESDRIGKEACGWIERTHATADIDLQRLQHDRQISGSWQQAAKRSGASFRVIPWETVLPESNGSLRHVPATPFVPPLGTALHERCQEIFGIQCAALAKRIRRIPESASLNIGVSGGLDSTLALLVAARTCAQQGWPVSRIHGITMPGFGTTPQTLNSARELMGHLGVTSDEIDIRQLCFDTFVGLRHQPFGITLEGLNLEELQKRLGGLASEKRNDLVFENVQARTRTLLLMSRGFVLGTGDLSEQALGWSTYNGDHMSMYNVNTSIPKTLVRFLVTYLAENEFKGAASECLKGIVETPISPELLPPSSDGAIEQFTEQTIGAYELHDFFLYHMIRFGMLPSKILHLAGQAEFSKDYSSNEIRDTLEVFLKRFFANQFKRSCVPDGPKVGSISLSPRGDWRMPSDADVNVWLQELRGTR